MHTFRTSKNGSTESNQLSDSLGEDVNPSAYLVNLADCMLVLACGFLVALVVAGSGIGQQLELLSDGDLEEVDIQELAKAQDEANSGAGYMDVGDVYMDPETGNYYLVERETQ